ncbi:STT3 domain-containing protein [Limisalsivibrio acetivorans]|uniref:STT3 domain-containing protein n=1 Tax=Limisalsivibrio acetivorans TaxID=1304888 RepID=UPI0003B373B1|nr:STT3 domain-containing protein [Limisalsivibrio acetivorans]
MDFRELLTAKRQTALWLVLIFIALCFAISAGARYNHLLRWKQNPDRYFVGDTPQTTTLDSYKWIRYAQEYREGAYYPADNDTLMFYPDLKTKHDPFPMPSWIMAVTADFFGGSVQKAGIYIFPILASLFVIPLGLYFYFMGFPAMGIAGSIAGSMAVVYMNRSSFGRIDTDALNLFFPFLASMFMLLAFDKRGNYKQYLIYSALSGLSMLLFWWWYAHPGITIVYMAVFVFLMLIGRVRLLHVLYGTLLFIICSNPLIFYNGVRHIFEFAMTYIAPAGHIDAGFPDVYETISEAKKASFQRALSIMNPNMFMGVLGLGAFIIAGLANFRRMLPLAPVFMLGILVFKSSNRFGMFLAPFIGMGIGYIIAVAGKYAAERMNLRPLVRGFLTMGLAFGILVVNYLPSFSFTPIPSIEPKVYARFDKVKEFVPEDGVILSWWDYGLGIEESTGRATFHDGMSQRTPKTYFIAKALSSGDQEVLADTVAFLGSRGLKGVNELIAEGESVSDVVQRVTNNDIPIPDKKYYVLITSDMFPKLAAIGGIGSWNFDTKESLPFRMTRLRCTDRRGDTLICGNNRVDLAKGIVNGGMPLKSLNIIVNGKLNQKKEYPYSTGYHFVQNVNNGRVTGVVLVDDRTYNSNLFKMYVIGDADNELFEEVYSSYPYLRLFEVKPRG